MYGKSTYIIYHACLFGDRFEVSAKLLSKLRVGEFFGGGDLLMGEGELQRALSVRADTPMQLYAIAYNDLQKHASPELLAKCVFSLQNLCSLSTSFDLGLLPFFPGDLSMGPIVVLPSSHVKYSSWTQGNVGFQ